jgi:hypothetical protein
MIHFTDYTLRTIFSKYKCLQLYDFDIYTAATIKEWSESFKLAYKIPRLDKRKTTHVITVLDSSFYRFKLFNRASNSLKAGSSAASATATLEGPVVSARGLPMAASGNSTPKVIPISSNT